MKWRGYCDSYSEPAPSNSGESSSGTLIHTKAAPLILTEPPASALRFANSDQSAYFEQWAELSVGFLSGSVIKTQLWTATMPQLSLNEATLRYGAMAVGALRTALKMSTDPHGMLQPDNRHYMNAMVYYCEALKLQASAAPSKDSLRTALLSSLLFICFETLRGNLPVALKHITHGFSMLNELANCTEKAPDLVRIAPAPPAMVQEILDCYKPLEQQSRSFMGSYKKFFFQGKPGAGGPPAPAAPDSGTPATPGSALPSPPNMTASSPPVQQLSSPQRVPNASPYSGLPSPASQDSPQSHGFSPGSQPPITPPSQAGTPPRGPPGAAPGAPPRPPGIQPFSKHTPYFRPKLTHVTELEKMPQYFKDYEETIAYWSLVQKRLVRSLPLLTATTSKLALPRAKDEAEVAAKLDSILEDQQLCEFVADSRFWINRWFSAYEPLYNETLRNRHVNQQAYLDAINTRLEFLIISVYQSLTRYSPLSTARSLTPVYREMAEHAEALMKARPTCGFAMDNGCTWPLFVAAFGCRDPEVRQYAIRVLGKYPMRNVLRDSRVFRAIAIKNNELEKKIMEEGDEDTQWLRMRRREVLFEDFGSCVVFRSPVKNEETGEWELIEESADFTIHEDGLLRWKRQEITDAASILGGVC